MRQVVKAQAVPIISTHIFFIVLLLLCFAGSGFAQQKNKQADFYFKQDKNPLEVIIETLDKDPRAFQLDTLCLNAYASVRFQIVGDGQVDHIAVSIGAPKVVKELISSAIFETGKYWSLGRKNKNVTIIIPLFIFPAFHCKPEQLWQDYSASMAQLLKYEGEYNRFKIWQYFDYAIEHTEGVIFPPLIIKGSIHQRDLQRFPADK